MQRFPAGEIDVRLDIHGGRIASRAILRRLHGACEVSELEARLRGCVYERGALSAALAEVDVRDYFGDISAEDVLELLAP